MKSLAESIESDIQFERTGSINGSEDPMPKLLSQGLVQCVGNGLFVLHSPLTEIMDALDHSVAKLAKSVRAESLHVPVLLSPVTMEDSQYLHSFGNQALVARGQMGNPGNGYGEGQVLGLVSPTVCYHVFAAKKGSHLSHSALYTALGRCSRVEAGPLSDLSRLTNFTMREIIGFGSEPWCQSQLLKISEKLFDWLNDSLDLSYQYSTASDPFFGQNDGIKKKAQLLAQSKFEVQARLAHRKDPMSVISMNQHGSVFYDRFEIKAENNVGYSFCIGVGYERLLYAILSQKGLDFKSSYYRKLLSTSAPLRSGPRIVASQG